MTRETGRTAFRKTNWDRATRTSYTVGNRFRTKRPGSLGGPVHPFLVDGVKALETTRHDRIDTDIVLILIALRPNRIICAKAVLFAIDADPVVNDVIDVQCLTQIDDQLLELVKPVCGFEPLQQAVQFVSHQCAPGLQGSRMSTLFLPMPLPRLHASGPSQEENRSGTRRTPSRPEHQLSTFVPHSQSLTIR